MQSKFLVLGWFQNYGIYENASSVDSICNLCWDVEGVGSVCVNYGTLGNKCPCQHKQNNFS